MYMVPAGGLQFPFPNGIPPYTVTTFKYVEGGPDGKAPEVV